MMMAVVTEPVLLQKFKIVAPKKDPERVVTVIGKIQQKIADVQYI
jgi:hypothetical protein